MGNTHATPGGLGPKTRVDVRAKMNKQDIKAARHKAEDGKAVHRGRRERERIVNLFAKFDVDGSKTLTADEIMSILTHKSEMSVGMDDSTARQIIASFDTNNDGALSINEFAEAFATIESRSGKQDVLAAGQRLRKEDGGTSKLQKRTERMEIVEAFFRFDKDGSKLISPEEMLLILKHSSVKGGAGMSDKDALEFIRQFDADGNGELDIKEFKLAFKALQNRCSV